MADEVFTIVALGDCNTCGITEVAGRVVPQLVAEGLQQPGRNTHLINLGLAMSTTREGVARIHDLTGPFDLLLVNYGLVDAWTTSLPGMYISYYPDHRWKMLGRKILKAVKRRLRSPFVRRFLPVGEVVPREEYEANLRAIIARARERSPQVPIVLWGTARVQSQPTRNDMIDRYNLLMKYVADTSPGVVFCDTSDIVSQLPPDQIHIDGIHLSQFSAQRIAAEILKRLASGRSPLSHSHGTVPSNLPNEATHTTPCERCQAA